MSFVRFLGPCLVIGSVIIACTGDPDVGESSSSSGGALPSSGKSSSGGKSGRGVASSSDDDYGSHAVTSSSGYHPSGPQSGSSSGGDLLDGTKVRTLKMSVDVCGKPPGYCGDAQSYAIDFDKGTLTTTTCVELGSDAGTQDVETTRAVTSEALLAVQKQFALLEVGMTHPTGYDGPIKVLDVTYRWPYPSSHYLFSPEAGCGPQHEMSKIGSGWTELWDAVRAL